MATQTKEFFDSDDNTELMIGEVFGQSLDPRLSFTVFPETPYLDRHEVIELRDYLNDWLARTPV